MEDATIAADTSASHVGAHHESSGHLGPGGASNGDQSKRIGPTNGVSDAGGVSNYDKSPGDASLEDLSVGNPSADSELSANEPPMMSDTSISEADTRDIPARDLLGSHSHSIKREHNPDGPQRQSKSVNPDHVETVTEVTKPLAATREKIDLTPGTWIENRYMLEQRLGEGGMGVVYKAYDEELGRHIALKILRLSPKARLTIDNARRRMHREAQALAQLSHPNVIAVYDVGMIDDKVFLAMELVEGQTLRRWLSSKARPLRDVIHAFAEAARGLAAAHKEGLIHRDFKPTNVIIGDDDRVRILDFGLARIAERDDSTSNLDESVSGELRLRRYTQSSGNNTPLRAASTTKVPLSRHRTLTSGLSERLIDTHLTEAGAIMGTPAYMSPEQHQGTTVDARGDQFAFCVALYEALYGQKPFAGRNVEALKKNLFAGKIQAPPKSRRVPKWLHRIVVRGLQINPENRYESMDLLLQDLERDRGRNRRMALAVILPILTGLIAALLMSLNEPEDLCRGSEDHLRSVWTPEIKRSMRMAFLATTRAHADETSLRVSENLDRYGRQWVNAHIEACEATHKRGEQSIAVMDLRMGCLSGKLRRMKALIDALSSNRDGAVVDSAIKAVLALPGIDSCADAEALTKAYPLPDGQEERRQIEEAELLVDEVNARIDMGQGSQILDLAMEAQERAESTRFPPLLARALFALASVLEYNDRYKEAELTFQRAGNMAAQANDDTRLAQSWIELFDNIGYRQGRHDDAFKILHFAETAITRAGNPKLLTVRLLRHMGYSYSSRGRYREAQEHHEKALAILERLQAEDPSATTSLQLWLSIRYGLASTLQPQAKYEQAQSHYEDIRQTIERHFGPNHVYMSSVLGPLADLLSHRGAYAQANHYYSRAIDIQRKNRGDSTATTAAILVNYADNLYKQRKIGQATEHLERAYTIRMSIFGPDHPDTADVLSKLADCLVDLGRYDEAEAKLKQAQRIYDTSVGITHPNYAAVPLVRGRLAAARNQLDAAVSNYSRALDITQNSLGREHPHVTDSLQRLGQVASRRKEFIKALEYYEEARLVAEVIYGKHHVAVAHIWLDIGQAQLELGQLQAAQMAFEESRTILARVPEFPPIYQARTLTGLATVALSIGLNNSAALSAGDALEQWKRVPNDVYGTAEAQFILAQALWNIGDSEERALRLAVEAKDALSRVDDHVPQDTDGLLSAVNAWLAQNTTAGE